jgi:two-component sensor histidine kinase
MPNLDEMVERQRVLAAFGEFALRCEDLDAVLTECCRLVAAALNADLAKVMEIEQDGEHLLIRAGVGWRPGVVGEIRLPMCEQSSEQYSIRQGRPVITKDIAHEDRFVLPPFLKDHGVVALVNTPIFLPGGKPYGLLQVDMCEPRDLDEQDIEFLRTYTAILGPVIDRLHKAHSLKVALETNKRLFQELQHRVKNHIMIITGVVRMRARAVQGEEARLALAAVAERIEALRLVHEQLYMRGAVEGLRLRPYIVQLVENLCHLHQEQAGRVRLTFDIEEAELPPDIALPLGLILNEFVTNTLKYAFDGKGGEIAVSLERSTGNRFQLLARDNGKGLPPAGQVPARAGSGTGFKLMEGLARQIGARPVWSRPEGKGTCLWLEFDATPNTMPSNGTV